jgi:UDPglucose 6-dehydrogenase
VPRALISLSEAEMTKVAWNFYFCMKISFANILSRLADRSGGINVDRVTETLSIDPRIGKGFLKAGMPFGGPCFPRDVDAMAAFMSALSEDTSLATAVSSGNENHYAYIVERILAGRPTSVGILGLAFKAGTSVTVHSPSFKLIERLLEKNIVVCVHDRSPLAVQALAQEPWAHAVHVAQTAEDLCRAVDTAVVAVNDPLYADLDCIIDRGKRIIDPWGHVRSTFPGLDKVGRASQRERDAIRIEPV